MAILSMLMGFGGIILFFIGVLLLIIKVIKRKKKKVAVLTIIISVVLFFAGVMLTPLEETTSTNDNVSNEITYSDTEVFAAEFCMAYMNSLKNPYSFSVKSIWAMDVGDGKYQVYVKYTAQNSFGGDVADQIGTMGDMTKAQLKELASGGEYVSIHTWGSEPSGKIIGKGENLDADKIQMYINEHYE